MFQIMTLQKPASVSGMSGKSTFPSRQKTPAASAMERMMFILHLAQQNHTCHEKRSSKVNPATLEAPMLPTARVAAVEGSGSDMMRALCRGSGM